MNTSRHCEVHKDMISVLDSCCSSVSLFLINMYHLHCILVRDVFTGRYDSRVKAMEVDERPTEQYGDIGGLDKQIQEVCSSL